MTLLPIPVDGPCSDHLLSQHRTACSAAAAVQNAGRSQLITLRLLKLAIDIHKVVLVDVRRWQHRVLET